MLSASGRLLGVPMSKRYIGTLLLGTRAGFVGRWGSFQKQQGPTTSRLCEVGRAMEGRAQ